MELKTFDPSTLSYEQSLRCFFTKPIGEFMGLDLNGEEFVLHEVTRLGVIT
jgi:hypothetical protein